MLMGRISVKEILPKHMQEVRIYIENPLFGSFEQNAVLLGFTGKFYDPEDQMQLDFITKWTPLPDPPKGYS
jgi:hypothetical protein